MIEALVQVGQDRPPVHDDGSAVITPRVWDTLMPVEQAHWSGNALRGYLSRALWSSVGPGLIDGWDLDDFVADGLLIGLGNPVFEPWQVAHRVRSRIIDRRRRGDVLQLSSIDNDPEYRRERVTASPNQADNPWADSEYVPSVFPDEVWAWIRANLTAKMAEGIRLWLEEQYTHEEVAKLLKVTTRTVERAVYRLRTVIETYPVRD
jgi:hypothetical protein